MTNVKHNNKNESIKIDKYQKEIESLTKRINNIELNLINKSKTKDKDAPKKVQNPYIFFKNEKIKEFKFKNPDQKVNIINIAKDSANEWMKIKNDENIFQKYKKMQEDDEKRFKKENDIYSKKLNKILTK